MHRNVHRKGKPMDGEARRSQLENDTELSLSRDDAVLIRCWTMRKGRKIVVQQARRDALSMKDALFTRIFFCFSSHPTEIQTEPCVILELTMDEPPLDGPLASLHPSLIPFLCKFLRPSSFIPICISVRCRWCATHPSHTPRPKLEA